MTGRPGAPPSFPPTTRELPAINLTPLIDILFIVLLFLVLTTSFDGTVALDVSLPTTQSAETVSVDRSEVVRIVVDADGQIYLRDRPVTLSALAPELEALADLPSLTLLIAADARATHGAVVTVLDHASRAGITALRLESTPANVTDGR